ncbi:hypothetical protein [Profundibacter sp.]
MKREIITIPRRILRVQTFDWLIDWRGQRSGEGLSGVYQTVFSSFPRWIGTLDFNVFRDEILKWRAVHAAAMSEINIYRIEMLDVQGLDFPAQSPANGVPHVGGAVFQGGAGYSYEPFVFCPAGASRGDTSVVVETPAGVAPPTAGRLMSYDDWPFVVTSVRDLGGSQYALTVKPSIRGDIPAGARINLRARGLFYAENSDRANPAYGLNRASSPKLQLVEYLNR